MPTITKPSQVAEEHILLPSSSEEEDEDNDSQSDLSDVEHDIEDPFRSDEESDSDDAPEALSFKSAQESLLFQKEQTREVIRTHNEEKRRKRKELQDHFMTLKEEKKRRIEDKMLPDEVLQNLNDEPSTNLEPECREETSSVDDDEDFKNDCTSTKELSEEHGPVVFKCKILSEEDKKPRYIPEEALSFKDRLLYGNRIRREKSTHQAILKKEKQDVKKRHF